MVIVPRWPKRKSVAQGAFPPIAGGSEYIYGGVSPLMLRRAHTLSMAVWACCLYAGGVSLVQLMPVAIRPAGLPARWPHGGRMVTYDGEKRAVRPLTRRDANGAVYTRTAEVERQIARTLGLDADQLIVQARISSATAPNCLHEECLVYLIREYHRRGQAATVGALFEILLQRCERLFRRRLGSLDRQMFLDAHGDCVAKLVEQVLTLTNDRSDFLQVRFWTALNRLAITAFNRYSEQQRRDAYAVPIGPQLRDDDPSESVVDPPAPTLLIQDLVEGRDAISAIPEPYRTAFVLRHYCKLPIEDSAPGARSISGYFKKDPRTINNYLRRAHAALAAWRGESA